MHILAVFFFLSLSPLFATVTQEEPFFLPPEIELLKLRLEKQALEQANDVINQPKRCRCLKFTGKQFIACMDYISKEDARFTFGKMSIQARIRYLLSMNLLEYKRFLDTFETEEQWRETLALLPAQEQKLLPQTVLAQLVMIRNTWMNCAPRKAGLYASGTTDPQAKDLSAWRDAALDGHEYMQKNCSLFWRWLDERFTEQKQRMFNNLKSKAVNTKKE